jgi:hypothetical protein
MPIWIIVAALGSIGITALLISVLWRVNAAAQERQKRGEGDDSGHTPVVSSDGGGRRDSDLDGSSSDGGGDGGGGGK